MKEEELTDDDDVGGAGCPAGDVGGSAGIHSDVTWLGSVDHQRTLAGLRVERGDVTARHQHQVHLVLQPRDLGHRDTGHGRRELAGLTITDHARLDRT